jgi:catechol 2,3-dioxygenase-like lactoylglutathione lyase family enzyme
MWYISALMSETSSIVYGVHHIALPVRNLECSVAFYHRLLGLPYVENKPVSSKPHFKSVWLKLFGGSILMLEQREEVAPQRNYVLALSIQRHQRCMLMAHLSEAGFPAEEETLYTFYVWDPDGHRLGFSHWPVAHEGALL